MAASSETLTQKWLRQNIHLYAHRDTVYSHVDAALSRFSTIRPKTDIYTYDDGRTQLLLCLHGLLPIAYRGASYHIPIAVWITREYPRLSPIAYVVPTSDMLVRASNFMDVSGKCQIEYLHNWERKSEACNLSALLEAMQEHFSREPPVYAKPKSPIPSSSSSSPPPAQARRPDSSATATSNYSERPPPPLPGTRPHVAPSPPHAAWNDDRPPLPVKPGVSPALALPSATPPAQEADVLSPNNLNTSDWATRPPPPLPSHPQPPTNTGVSGRVDSSSPIPPRYDAPTRAEAGHAPSSSVDLRMRPPPPPPATSPPPPSVSQIASSYASPSAQYPPSTQYVSHPVQLPPRPPTPPPPPLATTYAPSPGQYHTTSYSPVYHQPQALSPQSTGSIQPPYRPPPPVTSPANYASPQQIASLPLPPPPPVIPPPDLLDDDSLSSIPATALRASTSAPAPPRPPNPELLRLHAQVHEKFSSELASLSQAMALDAERMRAIQADLLTGEPAIRDEMARLEAVRDVCRGVAGRLRSVVEAAERNVGELKRKGDPEVDELVCSTSIVHNQLINLVAEDNAIEDTMYHLHRALNAGRIDLDRFLKTTRVLAEEQFMKRALIEKIQNGIPMGPEWQ